MDKPTRKNNRIQDYNYSQNGSYFITICTAERARILSRIIPGNPLPGGQEHVTTELLPFGKIADKYIKDLNSFYTHITIDKYVIMPDHIHFLITIHHSPTDGLSPDWRSSEISRFIGTFKRFCNKEYGKNIWQARFYDHVIRNEQDYADAWEYIDTNPFHWLVKHRGYL